MPFTNTSPQNQCKRSRTPDSFIKLVEACDNFPYGTRFAESYYRLYLPQDDLPHGYIHPSVVDKMPWTAHFHVDATTNARRVDVLPDNKDTDPSAAVTAAFAELIDLAISKDIFSCLGGRHSEPFAIPGARYPVQIERFACSLFGVTTRGAHLTAYTRTADGLRFWVPRRSERVGTWAGKLDSTVAGGVAAGESPFENIVREGAEEASFPEELVRTHARSVGALSYMGMCRGEHGWTVGMALPDVVYVFDLEVGEDVVPKPCDDEVKEFFRMSVEEVKQGMLTGQFKPNSAVIMVDFFIRHGLIAQEGEDEMVEMLQRMHRRLPFPVTPGR